MNNKQIIPIHFGIRSVIFLILLEALTVPLVATSNHIVIKSIWYMIVMGFTVAFICVLFLIKVLKKVIIKHSLALFGMEAENIYGLWYTGILAGILLMVMFFVQSICFTRLHWSDYSTGFMSAFISVLITLLFYRLVAKLFAFTITLYHNYEYYRLSFRYKDILFLAVMFGLYELIVCPITGLWIPYLEYRFILGVVSGVLGGASGGVLLVLLSRVLPIAPCLILEKIHK